MPGSRVAGRAYFISQGEPLNCWQWIDALLALAGLPQIRKSMSLRAAWAAGQALELFYRVFRLPGEPPMTRFLAAQLARCHYFDIHRAREDFGYRPRQFRSTRGCSGWRRVGASRARFRRHESHLSQPIRMH